MKTFNALSSNSDYEQMDNPSSNKNLPKLSRRMETIHKIGRESRRAMTLSSEYLKMKTGGIQRYHSFYQDKIILCKHVTDGAHHIIVAEEESKHILLT